MNLSTGKATKSGHPLMASDIARQIGCSRAHLSRLFRSQTGRNITEYHLWDRVHSVLIDITWRNRPMKQIAQQIGCQELHEFNRLVRRVMGYGPRTLRKMYGYIGKIVE